jgi:hypothetical protein
LRCRKFSSSVAETDTLILPIHSPTPTAGFVTADGDRAMRLEG